MTTTPTTRKPAAKKAAPKKAAPTSTATSSAKSAGAKSAGAKSAGAKATAAAKSFPSFDFSKFEMPKFEMPKGTPKFEIPKNIDGEKLIAAIRDAAYTTVGFGVLAFQQAQVRRQELAGKIAERFGVNKTQVEEMIKSVESRIAKLDDRFEARLDETVGKLEDRLPAPAGKVLGQAHGVAKAARKQVRTLLTSVD
jgi:hypothetical protein